MQRLVSLWKNTSKNGKVYYTGKLGNVGLVAFENDNKTNEKQPDLTIYIKEEQKEEETKITNNEDVFEEFGNTVIIDNNSDFLE